MSEFDDQAVIARCLTGDDEAWRMLVERYHNLVYFVAQRIAKGAADDAAQETWFSVFRGLHLYSARNGATFATWLHDVTYKRACSVAKKRGLVCEPPDFVEQRYEGLGPDELAANTERAAIICEVLASIRPERRKVLELRYLKGKSREQITKITGLPAGLVKSYIYWGRKELLKVLRRRRIAGVLAGEVAGKQSWRRREKLSKQRCAGFPSWSREARRRRTVREKFQNRIKN